MAERYFFEVAYNGKNYHGWQLQNNAVTVQGAIEDAFAKVLRSKTPITGSGRTDTGVHCEQQFFHVDFDKPIDGAQLQYKLNSCLLQDISILSVKPVELSAHARFDAISRSYQYRISRKKDPFYNELRYFFAKPLDLKTMNEAALLLVGEHDFECFSKVKTEVNNFFCTIEKAEWIEQGDLLTFYITANRFLRGMVRAIVGTLLSMGESKKTIDDLKGILASKDRRAAGRAAPAHGLFLTEVKYPDHIFLN
ncbi:MAG: tRNA pseudouridine(38-40) synthase TruA [Bacteroidota bacterium]